jgi:putative transposase
MGVVVHPANIQDRDGARLLLLRLTQQYLRRLEKIWADGGYRGTLIDWVMETFGWILEIVEREEGQKGFVIQPKRWIVERTFGWLNRSRRLSKDYEQLAYAEEAVIYIAMIYLMLHRLRPG